jgi:Domain of unknown function (DUF4124)
LRPLALSLLLLAAFPAWAQMHKCVDERGVTYYSDTPRPGCAGGPVDIRPIPPVSGKESPRSSSLAGEDAEFKRRQIQREQAEAREKTALEQRCASLRSEYALLGSGVPIIKSNERGERVYLEDATRDARMAQIKEQMRACP